MTVSFGFYNSVGGDRTYDAIDLSSIFDGIITDGILEDVGGKMVVSAGTGMQVLVADGRAWFNHTWTLNDASLALAVPASHLTLPRIDTVVLEVDASAAVRANSIKIVQGTANAIPVPPTLINTSEVHQHPLAYISVAAGASSIVGANITNLGGTITLPWAAVPSAMSPGGIGIDVLQVQIFS